MVNSQVPRCIYSIGLRLVWLICLIVSPERSIPSWIGSTKSDSMNLIGTMSLESEIKQYVRGIRRNTIYYICTSANYTRTPPEIPQFSNSDHIEGERAAHSWRVILGGSFLGRASLSLAISQFSAARTWNSKKEIFHKKQNRNSSTPLVYTHQWGIRPSRQRGRLAHPSSRVQL